MSNPGRSTRGRLRDSSMAPGSAGQDPEHGVRTNSTSGEFHERTRASEIQTNPSAANVRTNPSVANVQTNRKRGGIPSDPGAAESNRTQAGVEKAVRDSWALNPNEPERGGLRRFRPTRASLLR